MHSVGDKRPQPPRGGRGGPGVLGRPPWVELRERPRARSAEPGGEGSSRDRGSGGSAEGPPCRPCHRVRKGAVTASSPRAPSRGLWAWGQPLRWPGTAPPCGPAAPRRQRTGDGHDPPRAEQWEPEPEEDVAVPGGGEPRWPLGPDPRQQPARVGALLLRTHREMSSVGPEGSLGGPCRRREVAWGPCRLGGR